MKVSELRKILREDGKKYKLKTKTVRFGSLGYPAVVTASIYKNDKFIVGAEQNVYSKSYIEKHKKTFNLYKKIKREGLYNKDGVKLKL